MQMDLIYGISCATLVLLKKTWVSFMWDMYFSGAECPHQLGHPSTLIVLENAACSVLPRLAHREPFLATSS